MLTGNCEPELVIAERLEDRFAQPVDELRRELGIEGATNDYVAA